MHTGGGGGGGGVSYRGAKKKTKRVTIHS
eukprot:COSAG04_NODE_1496_length_6528_cov_6.474568_6_plen_28_part_01